MSFNTPINTTGTIAGQPIVGQAPVIDRETLPQALGQQQFVGQQQFLGQQQPMLGQQQFLGQQQPMLGQQVIGQQTLTPFTTATTVLPNAGLGQLRQHHSGGVPLTAEERNAWELQQRQLASGQPLFNQQQTLLQQQPLLQQTRAAPILGAATATNIIEHAPIIEREVVVQRPVEIRREHHVQPIIHEREVQIQPIIQTQVTTERKVVNTSRDVLLAPIVEQPMALGTAPLVADQRSLHTTTGLTNSTGLAGQQTHVGIGQKIKGTIKETSGKLTHNPAKVAEGHALKTGQPIAGQPGFGNTSTY